MEFDKYTLLIFLFITTIFLILLLNKVKTSVSQYLTKWFEKKVTKSASKSGGYKGAAAFQLMVKLISIFIIPAAIWLTFNNYLLLILSIFLIYKVPKLIDEWRINKRRQILEKELPIALAMIASGLSSGSSLTSSISVYVRESKSPLSHEFSHFVRVQRLGVEIDEALEQVDRRVNLPDFTLIILAMRISKQVGGNLSETLVNLGNSLQMKLLIEGKIKALTAQGVMQAWLMSLLPVLVAAGITLILPEQMDKLYNTLVGNLVLVFCGILNYIGFKVIKKILTIDV